MNRKLSRFMVAFLACLMIVSSVLPAASAAQVEDSAVQDVVEQLEQIDTLQQIQKARKNYAVKSRYLSTTTNASIIEAHEAKRVLYNTYVSEMFAARAAAQQAYNALTEEQKAQIAPELVEQQSAHRVQGCYLYPWHRHQ